VLQSLNRDEEAVARYEQAVALNPNYIEAHGNLGAALNKLERYEEAIAHFERALELNPNLAEAHNDIGNALVALERHEAAVERYRRALAIRPGFGQAHNHLGNVLALLDRHSEAIPHFRAALALDPTAGGVHASLGSSLSALDLYDEAIPHLRAARDLRPNSPERHWQLGNALESAGRSEAAVECQLRALAIDPAYAEAHNGLGFSLLSLGRLAEGRRALQRAIELAPKVGHFHRNLAMSKRFAADDPQLRVMEELAGAMSSLDEHDRMELQFALGKAYADLGRQEEALRHLIGANALKRKHLKYDATTVLGQINRIAEIFTSEFIREKSGRGQPSDLPVFIVGMPRSGSTLIEQILASHPAVFGGGELPNFGQAASSLCGIPAAMPSAESLVESLADLPAERLGEVGARYLDSVGALAPEAQRITDKLPANFRMIGLIHLALPRARIIHARRDPLDTCLSCFERNFGKNSLPFTYDLAELGRYYRAYETLMAHWRDVLPAGTILDVRYEDLVADFEPQARRLIAYCGLDWDERCRAFYKTERPIHTASVAQVREPLYGSSVGRWRAVEHLLRPLLEGLAV
jgi:tetratricopeptide (TPR) repeat protein